MTKLLEEAFRKALALPARDQDALADWLLQEMESDLRWSELFSKSQGALRRLAAEALEEHRRGETKKESHCG